MGVGPFRNHSKKEYSGSMLGRSSGNTEYVTVYKNLPNPDPSNYEIVDTLALSEYVIMKIKYLDCTNFEGNKILVFKCQMKDLLDQKLIDPHFSDNKKFISPIARFEPTEQGWNHAVTFVENINK